MLVDILVDATLIDMLVLVSHESVIMTVILVVVDNAISIKREESVSPIKGML